MTLATANNIWQQVLGELREYFDARIVKAHLTKSDVLMVEDGRWVIGVVSAYSAEELTRKVKGNILGFIEEHDSGIVDVVFVDRNDSGVSIKFQSEQLQRNAPNTHGRVPTAKIDNQTTSSNLTLESRQPSNERDSVRYSEPLLSQVDTREASRAGTTNRQDYSNNDKGKTVNNKKSGGQMSLGEMHEDVYADTTISLEDMGGAVDRPRSSGIVGVQGSVYTGLNPLNVFENFVVGSSNRVAFAAAQAVAESPGKAYNPLFIYGGVGLGKTHLMQAVGNAIVARFPNKKVQYFTSERFTNDFIASFKDKATDAFRKQYRALDIMLIDDIQFIAGKEGTQEEFFHTFNEIVGKGGHILMTSDKTPEEIGQLEERLVSRFKGGMMVDVGLPDYEMRVAIITARASEMRIGLNAEVVDFLAQNIQVNTREMSGTLVSIVEKVRSGGGEFNLENVKKAWGEDVSAGIKLAQKNVTPAKVMQVIHHYFNIKKADLTGKVRTRNFVIPRQLCMYILKEELGMALEKIGSELGGRDHTTIMHGVKAMQQDLSTSEQLRKDLLWIKQELSGQRG